MEYTPQTRIDKITEACLAADATDAVRLFAELAKSEFISIHGPEHHMLDGAVILTVYKCAGGRLDLAAALAELAKRARQMPGAMCGMWGVCGAVTSIGAALSIIEGTGPLTVDDSWGDHMQFTSAALAALAAVGGPRCCKRDGVLSLQAAVRYMARRYGLALPQADYTCEFSRYNSQCIGGRCPLAGGLQ